MTNNVANTTPAPTPPPAPEPQEPRECVWCGIEIEAPLRLCYKCLPLYNMTGV